MSETPVAETKAAKKEVVRTPVTMEDGRVVEFAGNRQADKNAAFDVETGTISLRIDFRNGKSVSLTGEQLSRATLLRAAAHGLSQKVGDSYASSKDVDDMHLAAEDMVKRLIAGEWEAVREAGDSMSGASVIIKALCEFTGKSVDDIKAFLEGKLKAAADAGQKLTRQQLYASFRANPKILAIIQRIEQEKATKGAAVDSNEMLAELAA
jgi:hypothetical protein